MHKFISTIAIVAFTSIALVGAASAMSGGGVDSKMATPTAKIEASPGSGPQWKPVGGGLKAGGGFAGGQGTEPGETFYPNGTSGRPRSDCLFAGGTPKSGAGADGAVIWLCL